MAKQWKRPNKRPVRKRTAPTGSWSTLKGKHTMKRVFLLGVIAYSVLLLVLQHWPNAVNETGVAAAPWMGLMIVDLAFAGTSLFKLFPNMFITDDDEDASLHAEDIRDYVLCKPYATCGMRPKRPEGRRWFHFPT